MDINEKYHHKLKFVGKFLNTETEYCEKVVTIDIGDPFLEIFDNIDKFHNLETFKFSADLAGFLFVDHGIISSNLFMISSFPESLFALPKLKCIEIKHCGLSSLPENIGQYTNIINLNFMGNQLEKIPESIGQLTKLKSLDLSYNKLQYLPESIGQLANLVYFKLCCNKLQYLPKSIKNLKQLKHILVDPEIENYIL